MDNTKYENILENSINVLRFISEVLQHVDIPQTSFRVCGHCGCFTLSLPSMADQKGFFKVNLRFWMELEYLPVYPDFHPVEEAVIAACDCLNSNNF
jgi:hypothetical protein